MRLALSHTATIARFSVQEVVSRRLILAGALLSLTYLALYAFGFHFAVEKVNEAGASARGRLPASIAVAALTLFGLYVVYFLGSFLALFLAVASVSGEIDSGTAHAVLARPIRRGELIVGRWAAYAGLLAVYVAAMVGATSVLARLIGGYEVPDPPRVVLMLAFEAVLLLSLTLLGSALLPTLANGIAVFTLFGLGWLAGIIQVLGAALENEGMLNLGTAVGLLMPADALWRGASYYVQSPALLAMTNAGSGAIPLIGNAPPTNALLVWSGLYVLACVGGAIAAFRRRDL